MKKVKAPVVFFLTIIAYAVLHVTEETLGNFPRFMQENWGIPDIGYGQWLYHNMVFFLPVLLLGFLIFLIDEEKYFPFGLAIPLWGVLNFLEHTFYTFKNLAVSPGFYSSLVFVLVFIAALYVTKREGKLTVKNTLSAIAISVSYWFISLLLVMLLAGKVHRIFS